MALTRATDKIIANADGNLNLSGIVTAANFVGGGAGLTGLNVDASALKLVDSINVDPTEPKNE